MAPRVSAEHKESRQEQILMAALRCFADKGWRKTTIRDICREARLSPGAVYSYFENKDAIILAINDWCRRQNQQAFAVAESRTDDIPCDAATALRQTLHAFLLRCKDTRFRTAIRADTQFFAEALSNPDLLHDYARTYENDILNHIVAANRRAHEEGHIDPELDPRALAQVLFSLVQGLHMQLLLDPALDIDAYTRAVDALVGNSLWRNDEATQDTP